MRRTTFLSTEYFFEGYFVTVFFPQSGVDSWTTLDRLYPAPFYNVFSNNMKRLIGKLDFGLVSVRVRSIGFSLTKGVSLELLLLQAATLN